MTAIIEDDESDALSLPRGYGVDDIPVVLQDRRFDRGGQMPYAPDRRPTGARPAVAARAFQRRAAARSTNCRT